MTETENRHPRWLSDVAVAVLIAGLAGVLLIAGPALHRGMAEHPSSISSLQFPNLMGLASSALGLGLLLWWSVSLLMAFVGQLLCFRGHIILGARVSALSPGFMRRLVLLVLSMNLLASPAVASAPGQDTAPVQTSEKQMGSVRQGGGSQTKFLAPMWEPTTHGQAESIAADVPGPRWTPTKTAAAGSVLTRGPLRNADTQTRERTVTVQPGDSLWSLCAEHLGTYATDVEIATEWPKWYAENRKTIGPDAGLLLPGQVLRIPTTTTDV
ncbi:LysM peptidoglycan-binding domain-containing protein [Arthrobacter pigmenti]